MNTRLFKLIHPIKELFTTQNQKECRQLSIEIADLKKKRESLLREIRAKENRIESLKRGGK